MPTADEVLREVRSLIFAPELRPSTEVLLAERCAAAEERLTVLAQSEAEARAALQRERERLDWLDAKHRDNCVSAIWWGLSDATDFGKLNLSVALTYSLRAAIDAARAAEGKK